MVGAQKAAIPKPRAVVPDQRLVYPRSMHIALLRNILIIILRHQRIAVIQELRRAKPSAIGLEQATQRIVDQIRVRAAAGPQQPVLPVIGIARRPVRGQVAIGVVGEARRAGRAILVQTVAGVGAVRVREAAPRIAVVAQRVE